MFAFAQFAPARVLGDCRGFGVPTVAGRVRRGGQRSLPPLDMRRTRAAAWRRHPPPGVPKTNQKTKKRVAGSPRRIETAARRAQSAFFNCSVSVRPFPFQRHLYSHIPCSCAQNLRKTVTLALPVGGWRQQNTKGKFCNNRSFMRPTPSKREHF